MSRNAERTMAECLAKRINYEADRMDEKAAAEEHAGEQRTLMAVVRGMRRAASIADEFARASV